MREFKELTKIQKEKLAEIASNWWTNKISGNFHHDNGDKSKEGQFAMFLADLGKKQLTQEQINGFKTDLKAEIINAFEETYSRYNISLDCDYNPGYLLRKCAEKYNINSLNFPFKTSLYIFPTAVTVRDGYMTGLVEIFATKEYYEEKIENAKEYIKQCEEYKKDKNSFGTPAEYDEAIKRQKQHISNWQKIITENKYDSF